MIKKFIINKAIKMVKEYYPQYDSIQLEKIQYGLESIYLSITKIIVIITLSILLNIFIETFLLLLFYNLLRSTAFGLHASKSWICWITSIPTFIGIPFICKHATIPIELLMIIAILSLFNFILFAPADTHKRPLIRKKRRLIYKILTIAIGTIYLFLIIMLKNNSLKMIITFAMLIESILINPITYKLFNMPYNNYKSYKV